MQVKFCSNVNFPKKINTKNKVYVLPHLPINVHPALSSCSWLPSYRPYSFASQLFNCFAYKLSFSYFIHSFFLYVYENSITFLTKIYSSAAEAGVPISEYSNLEEPFEFGSVTTRLSGDSLSSLTTFAQGIATIISISVRGASFGLSPTEPFPVNSYPYFSLLAAQ